MQRENRLRCKCGRNEIRLWLGIFHCVIVFYIYYVNYIVNVFFISNNNFPLLLIFTLSQVLFIHDCLAVYNEPRMEDPSKKSNFACSNFSWKPQMLQALTEFLLEYWTTENQGQQILVCLETHQRAIRHGCHTEKGGNHQRTWRN